MYHDLDTDLMRAWQLLNEISDQNVHNHQMSMMLHTRSTSYKDRVKQFAAETPLRRFNVDISKEKFESELERTNAQTIIENHALLQENRQLSLLLKEYEQTMETIMSKFRSHALAAQQHELTLTRHYETLIAARETASVQSDLNNTTSMTQSLTRLAANLRALIRSMHGDDDPSPASPETDFEPTTDPRLDPHPPPQSEEEQLLALLDDRADWAHEREREIARLEAENAELRRTLGIDRAAAEANGWLEEEARELSFAVRRIPLQQPQQPQQQLPPPREQSPGLGMRAPQPGGAFDALGQVIGIGAGGGGGGGGGIGGAPLQNPGVPLQRASELQPGTRGAQGRRAAMFGSRGRGGAPQFWEGGLHNAGGPWQSQPGMDLSR